MFSGPQPALGRSDLLLISGIRVLSFLALIFLWWRGILLGRRVYHTYNIRRDFTRGLVALIVVLILSGARFGARQGAYSSADAWGCWWWPIFFFGLLAMTIDNLHRMRGAMQGAEGGLLPSGVGCRLFWASSPVCCWWLSSWPPIFSPSLPSALGQWIAFAIQPCSKRSGLSPDTGVLFVRRVVLAGTPDDCHDPGGCCPAMACPSPIQSKGDFSPVPGQ